MISENTVYDHSEETRLNMPVDEKKEEKTVLDSDKKEATPASKKGAWKKVAVGAGTGIVFGTATGLFASASSAENVVMEEESHTEEPHRTEQAVIDDGIPVATGVDDEMTFLQAFRAARIEVGAGGAFEWRGQTYSTYYAEEWESMTPEQRAEFNSHFTWSSHGNSSSDTAQEVQDTTTDTTDTVSEVHQDTDGHSSGEEHMAQEQDTVTSVSAEVSGNDVAVIEESSPEIEVLGVVYDSSIDANVGMMEIDDQPVLLIDVDADGKFDIMATDVDADGQFSRDEIADISNQNISVDDLGGLPPMDDISKDMSGDLDYSNDYNCYDV